MKKFKFFTKKTIIAGSVIFISFLFILMAFSPALAGTGQQTPQAITEKSYIPNPLLNTNVTWNTFNSKWSPLEYNNGTANSTLSAGYSKYYKNPISVNPTDIIAPGVLQGDKIGSYSTWGNTSIFSATGSSNASDPIGISTSTLGSQTIIKETMTANGSGNTGYAQIKIPEAYYPSPSPQYDYLTIAISFSGATGAGSAANIGIENSTGLSVIGTSVPVGDTEYISEPLTVIGKGASFNTTGSGTSTYLIISFNIVTANGIPAGSVYTTTLTGLGFTDYPIPLGTNATGSPIINAVNPKMATFGSTALKYSQVINNGYTVALSKQMQNVTESQTSISDGSYIEQATYQGTLSLPTAPGLTYGTANISLNMTLPGSQYEVATLNGVSYLSGVQAKTNGTFDFGTVNPNSPNSMILEAKYTTAQWNASTHAPSFFTLRGLEYYWWVGVIAGLSIIGLGAAAVSHFGGDENDLKVPKGKFGR